jgi:hypothetical protein
LIALALIIVENLTTRKRRCLTAITLHALATAERVTGVATNIAHRVVASSILDTRTGQAGCITSTAVVGVRGEVDGTGTSLVRASSVRRVAHALSVTRRSIQTVSMTIANVIREPRASTRAISTKVAGLADALKRVGVARSVAAALRLAWASLRERCQGNRLAILDDVNTGLINNPVGTLHDRINRQNNEAFLCRGVKK